MLKYVLIFCTCAVVLILAREVLGVWYARRVGAEVVQQSSAYEQKVENPARHILVLGDSLAFGVGADNSVESVAGRIGYAYPRAHIENRAHSGFTIADVLEQVQNEKLEQYDMVLLQVGANDVLYFTPERVAREKLHALFNELSQVAPHVVFMWYGDVGLAPGLPPILARILHTKSMQMRTMYLEVAEQHGVHAVDLYEGDGVDSFGSDVERYYSKDKLHPSGAGYALWYERAEPTISTILNQ